MQVHSLCNMQCIDTHALIFSYYNFSYTFFPICFGGDAFILSFLRYPGQGFIFSYDIMRIGENDWLPFLFLPDDYHLWSRSNFGTFLYFFFTLNFHFISPPQYHYESIFPLVLVEDKKKKEIDLDLPDDEALMYLCPLHISGFFFTLIYYSRILPHYPPLSPFIRIFLGPDLPLVIPQSLDALSWRAPRFSTAKALNI